MTEMDKYNLLLKIMQENKEDTKALRDNSSEIKTELSKIGGQVALLRQELSAEKHDSREKFDIVHTRIDKEQQNVAKKIDDIESTLNEVAPKVEHMNKIFDWATRIIVTAMVVAVLYALVQYSTIK